MTITATTITPAQSDDMALQLEYDFVEIVREEIGLDEKEAARLAAAIVRGVRKRYGGRRLGCKGIYIPAPSKHERDTAIRAAYNGTNGEDVMRQHGIRRTQLFAIIKQRPGAPRPGVPGPKNPRPAPQP